METTMTTQISRLQKMGVKELQAKYEEVFGKSTKSRNAPWLFKVIARKLQNDEEPESAKKPVALPTLVAKYDRKKSATKTADKKSRSRRIAKPKKAEGKPAKDPAGKRAQHRQPGQRDPRLPKVGSTITREYKGKKLLVRVLDDGFEYQGKQYRSLSALAKKITGSIINGYAFFRLTEEPSK